MRTVSFSQFVQRLLHRSPKAASPVTAPALAPAVVAASDTWAPAAPPRSGVRPGLVPVPPEPLVVPVKVGKKAVALWAALHIEDSLRAAMSQGLQAAEVPAEEADSLVNDVLRRLRDADFAYHGAELLARLCSAYELRALPAALEEGLTPLRLALPGAVVRAVRRVGDPTAALPHPNDRNEVQRFARVGMLLDNLASPAGFGPLLPNNALALVLSVELDDDVVRRAAAFYDSALGSVYATRLIPALNAWCAQFLEKLG